MNVFNSVTSARAFSYHYVLHYFLTMPVGFDFNLTYGLKPQVSGIKIVTSIFQVEWLIATLIVHVLIKIFLLLQKEAKKEFTFFLFHLWPLRKMGSKA